MADHGSEEVLENLLGVTDPNELDSAEDTALQRAYLEAMASVTADKRMSAETVRELHRKWLGEIYSWAGNWRPVDIAKDGMKWCHWAFIPREMERFEIECLGRLTPCRAGDVTRVANDIAVVHGELMAIHPFRDGNGRVGRLIAVLMGLQAGFGVMRYSRTDAGRVRYLAAVAAAFVKQDYRPLTDFFSDALVATTGAA